MNLLRMPFDAKIDALDAKLVYNEAEVDLK